MKINHPAQQQEHRKGAFLVLAFFCLIVCTSFVAFSVDIGYLNVSKVELQNCVDAAALAAAQEISAAVQNAPPGTTDITAYAQQQARIQARDVAQLNGFYVDKDNDVEFGLRSYDPTTDSFGIEWGVSPSNVVKVTARRDNEDLAAPDSKLKLFFAGVAGDGYAKLKSEAIAFVESRDIVVVHDFSRSMNFDSYFNDEADDHLSDSAVIANLEAVWDDLGLSLGSLTFTPTYMTLSDTEDGVTTSVTFKYDSVDVVTTGELSKVKLQYTNGSTDTYSNVSGTTATINGDRDIEKVWVTTEQSSGSSGSGSSSSGGTPETITKYGLTVTFAGDRKSYSVSGTEQLVYVDSYFTGGGYQYHDMPTPYPYSTSISESQVIDYVKIRSKVGGSYYWTTFDCSPPDDSSGSGSGGSGSSTDEVEQLFVDNNTNVKQAFGLNNISYPYASGSWDGVINHCRNHSELTSRGFREMYGGMGMVDYILRYHSGYSQTKDIWKTRHYPFHAIKEGHQLFCEFLQGLGFDDQIGMVSYDTHHRVESILNENDPSIPYVDISGDPITNDYVSVNNLMKYKQANHYYPSTNMGGGLKRGTELLTDHKRTGARATILLMTDGNTNTIDSGENTNLPSGWDWDTLMDYDGDGSADYTTNSSQKKYCLRKAYEARELGYTVHTMAVGIDADRDLMEAIAHLTNGHFINVPGGTSVLEMETEVRAAFHKIASFVPPAKLLIDTN